MVSAIQWIGEITLFGVSKQNGEEIAHFRMKLHFVFLKRGKRLILRRLIQLRENLPMCRATPFVKYRDGLLINLKRRQRCLPATQRTCVGLMRTFHIPIGSATEIASQLHIDKDRDTCFDGSGALALGRDQSCYRCHYESPLAGLRQIGVYASSATGSSCSSAFSGTAASPATAALAADALRKFRREGRPGRSLIGNSLCDGHHLKIVVSIHREMSQVGRCGLSSQRNQRKFT